MAEKTPKKKRKIPLIIKFMIFLMIALMIAFIAFYIYMKQKTDPTHIADEYIETFMSKDTSALFDMSGYEKGTFCSPETLKNSLEECHKYSSLSNYSLVEIADASNENQKQYGISYWDAQHTYEYSQTLTLKKSDTKLYFLFDNWIINQNELLATHCRIGAPSGATVSVDDIELSPEMRVDSTAANTVTYDIGNLFIGTHNIKVSLDGFNLYSTSLYVSKGDYSEKNLYTVTPSMLTVTPATEKTLVKTATEFIKELYSYALKEKSFASLAKKITFEASSSALLSQKYDALVTNNVRSSTHLTGVEFGTCKTSTAATYAEDGCYALNLIADINYSTTSSVVKINTSPDTGEAAKPTTQYKSGSSSSLFTITFHYKDGTWSIFDSTALDACIYYVKY